MHLRLDQVTLCAADSVQPALALRAILRSLQLCDFGDAVLFTNHLISRNEGIRQVTIEPLNSAEDYSRFILHKLVEQTRTPYILIVQWDGYVLDPGAWHSDFLNYDLIGAKWPWHKDGMTVGNGGFSLRSRRLLEVLATRYQTYPPGAPEDDLICRRLRPQLESEYAIRFAPEMVADAFSYERALPSAPTFGFHGLFNMWRHVEDAEMVILASEFSPHVLRSIEFHELLLRYFTMRKFATLGALYIARRKLGDESEFRRQISQLVSDAGFVDPFIRLCERCASSADEGCR